MSSAGACHQTGDIVGSHNQQLTEQFYDISKEHNVHIIPCTSFSRKLVFAVTELDRDMTVEMLQDGIKRKLKTTTCKTQHGRPKVSGRLSLLEKLHPSSTMTRRLCSMAIRHTKDDKYGLQSLATDMARTLYMSKSTSHETARRLCQSLLK